MLINLIFFLPVLFGNTLHIDKQEQEEEKKKFTGCCKKRQDVSSGCDGYGDCAETHF